ncbi:hypothetical protein GJAV_G00183310 [Gymnothorax javanicus]|nr:hypothetical protein GJAV_G00183310 [Gymnothorax javanicus]
MPGDEPEATSGGGAGKAGWQQQQPIKPGAAGGGTNHITTPLSQPSHTSLIRTSQLHALFLQQCADADASSKFLQLMAMHLEKSQHRPTVLRCGVQANDPAPPVSITNCNITGSSLQPVDHDSQQWSHSSKLKPSTPGPDEHRRSFVTQFRALFVNGLCRWPGCDEMFEEYPHFLKHLHSEHSPGERSLAQCRVQQDMVLHMENQLSLEKQKLLAMQIHLSSPTKPILPAPKECPEGSLSLFMDSPQPHVPGGAPYSGSKNNETEVVRPSYRPLPSSLHMPEILPSMEWYKYNNIRPPFTYASLIRWAILESPDRQLSLNQIYHWFTRMFFYFRHNTSTWKNAVRHNLSLHRCFVRLEKGKGAVWTVDESEFQKRRGQKFSRDLGMGYLTPYTFCPPKSWIGGLPVPETN